MAPPNYEFILSHDMAVARFGGNILAQGSSVRISNDEMPRFACSVLFHMGS